MFALIEGLSFGQVGSRVLHEVGLGLLAGKAVGPAPERRSDRVGRGAGVERSEALARPRSDHACPRCTSPFGSLGASHRARGSNLSFEGLGTVMGLNAEQLCPCLDLLAP